MKTIGLLGGMSWESTLPYYRLINETVSGRLGGLHSARLLLCSVDFETIERLQRDGAWERAGALLGADARRLAGAGADFLVLCTNTMHRVAGPIERAAGIPLLHIADATADEIRAAGLGCVGLLGTRFTMEQDFYRGRLARRHGLEVRVPEAPGRALVHRIIYDELCLGRVREASREACRGVLEALAEDGAQAIILGCTELSLLLRPADSPVPLFDTTAIHARRAAQLALAGD